MTEEENQKKENTQAKANVWMIVSIGLIVVVLVLAVLIFSKGITGGAISETKAGDNLVEFLNLKTGGGVSLVKVEKQDSLYRVTVSYQGQEIPVYMTQDGKYFLQYLENMTESNSETPVETSETAEDIPKSSKPVVELFVMSHCPYGTQAEKGIIPVVKLLGDKIDFKIRFVYYAMHGEKEVYEELNQYCIQEEQTSKYLDYLECFLNDSDGEGCLESVGIDMTKLNSCKASADEEFKVTENLLDEESYLSGSFPLFDINKQENEAYGIGGSPTLVINGVESSAGRDSASYLEGICGAFTESPSECEETLSSTSPSPGFGYVSTGSDSSATCG